MHGGKPPAELDGDTRHEDIDSDGTTTVADVQALFDRLDSPVVQNSTQAFDFDDDGAVTIFDVQTLFVKVT
jgi:hypothetical protein